MAAPSAARRDEVGEATYRGATAEALREEMQRDERVFLLGREVTASREVRGLMERFGPERFVDVPAAEDTIMGMAVGAAAEGLRPVVQLRARDDITTGFDQLMAAGALHYRSGVSLPLVVRSPSGGGVRGGPFHSGNPEPWLAHAPGIKVICPAFPTDAKGLLKSAIRDDNPCVLLEHGWINRRVREVVPDDPDLLVPIGKAEVKRRGQDVTIVASGAMVHRALEAAEDLAEDGVSAEVVDLRTISPLDTESILESVARTGRALVLYESLRFLGVGAEVAAVIAEAGFEHLDAPVVRVAPPNTPVPFSAPLEDAFLPQVEDIVEAVQKLSGW
jgi:2-oxoisovalerate dehydrogenase E1 component beta subunit